MKFRHDTTIDLKEIESITKNLKTILYIPVLKALYKIRNTAHLKITEMAIVFSLPGVAKLKL